MKNNGVETPRHETNPEMIINFTMYFQGTKPMKSILLPEYGDWAVIENSTVEILTHLAVIQSQCHSTYVTLLWPATWLVCLFACLFFFLFFFFFFFLVFFFFFFFFVFFFLFFLGFFFTCGRNHNHPKVTYEAWYWLKKNNKKKINKKKTLCTVVTW